MLHLRSSGRVFQGLVILLRYDLWKVKVLHFLGQKRRAFGLLADRVEREGTSGLGRMPGSICISSFKALKKKAKSRYPCQ